ncbi:hypothetical protein [Arthrobacter sp. Soil763]|uniref:hypothetical protein n=1 Tax=Arthrobacter sp. Soil763 TaxID=1736402 RepID=UPI0006F76A6E|nr:hypothetical protein [Arthrobacter sp. Soil763]KRE78533.1 hypothetical protein ASG71_11750 [Arthrobacter sp. Soil763]
MSGTGTSPLDSLVEQLWHHPVSAGQVRVVLNPAPDDGWREVESYWVLPNASRARLLVPLATPRVTAASLLQYRSLRRGKVNTARILLGSLARLGLRPVQDRLSVQERVVPLPGARLALPLAAVAARLQGGGTTAEEDAPAAGRAGRQLFASIGIREGDNRKPTLQLVDGAGKPAGYAKLAWNESSSEFIRTEIGALSAVGGSAGAVRAPTLLAVGTRSAFPYLVTEPLPLDVRAVRGRVKGPTPQELFALCPVSRVDRLSSTGHYQALGRRLAALDPAAEPQLAQALDRLAELLRERDPLLPVAERWHGDLVPWNTARDAAGLLWCWDWESCEPDAVAGLDAVHWMFSVRRERGDGPMATNLLRAMTDAGSFFEAAGLSREVWPVVAGVYAMVVAERAWTLAVRNGGWASSWITVPELVNLLDAAHGLLVTPDAQGSMGASPAAPAI